MTTATPKPNVTGVAIVLIAASAVAAFALIIALRNPVLFLYYAGLAVLLFGAGGYAAASRFRTERDTATAEWQRLERELEARAPGVTMVPHVTFPAPAVAAVVERPDLRIVPPQRDGLSPIARVMSGLPVADGAFPVHTAVDEDELTAVIRATEEI